MEKLVEIDGQQIKLKAHGNIPSMYMQQFGQDLFFDMQQMESNGLNFEVLNNLLWTFAKAANKEILPPEEWNESFITYPIFECLDTVLEMFERLMPAGKLEKSLQKTKSKRTKKS